MRLDPIRGGRGTLGARCRPVAAPQGEIKVTDIKLSCLEDTEHSRDSCLRTDVRGTKLTLNHQAQVGDNTPIR